MKKLTLYLLFSFSSICLAQQSEINDRQLVWLSDLLEKNGIAVGFVGFMEFPPFPSTAAHFASQTESNVQRSAKQQEELRVLLKEKEFMATTFPNRDALLQFAQTICTKQGYTFSLKNDVAHLLPIKTMASELLNQRIADLNYENQTIRSIVNQLNKKSNLCFNSLAGYALHKKVVSLVLPPNPTVGDVLDATVKSAKLESWVAIFGINPAVVERIDDTTKKIVLLDFMLRKAK